MTRKAIEANGTASQRKLHFFTRPGVFVARAFVFILCIFFRLSREGSKWWLQRGRTSFVRMRIGERGQAILAGARLSEALVQSALWPSMRTPRVGDVNRESEAKIITGI
jgi:hypothetical protein